MAALFTTYIYQPFFNILVGIYWLVGQVLPTPDMGIAVILFSIAVRFILLPINLSTDRSAEEKHEISKRIKALKLELANDPGRLKLEIRAIMRQSPGAIISEAIDVAVQLMIILILWRIFATGLEGADLHLIYPFMPAIDTPINLMFLGKYDLSHTNNTLNIIQSVMIFLSETLHMLFAPVTPSRKEFISLSIIFPIACFIIFLFLPSGKKLFIITSLAFSIIILLVRQLKYLINSLFAPKVVIPAPSDDLNPVQPPSELNLPHQNPPINPS